MQTIDIDAGLELSRIDSKFYRILKQFEPFGPQNMSPVFLSRNVYTYGQASIVGEKHLRMSVCQKDSPYFNCIGFGLGDCLQTANSGTPFDICYTIEEKTWKEKTSIQLNIRGIRPSSTA